MSHGDVVAERSPHPEWLPSSSPGAVQNRRYVKSHSGFVLGQDAEVRKDLLAMTDQATRKCAHIACFCDVPNGQEYCGDACREAGREDVDIACQCDHLACSLKEVFLFHSAEA
jgi:hypothetical protein